MWTIVQKHPEKTYLFKSPAPNRIISLSLVFHQISIRYVLSRPDRCAIVFRIILHTLPQLMMVISSNRATLRRRIGRTARKVPPPRRTPPHPAYRNPGRHVIAQQLHGTVVIPHRAAQY